MLLTGAHLDSDGRIAEDLAWIERRARYWWELDEPTLRRALDEHDDGGGSLAERWREVLDDRDSTRLERRLAWAARDRRRAGRSREPGRAWREVLNRLLTELAGTTPGAATSFPQSAEGLPFVDALAPALEVARRLLRARLSVGAARRTTPKALSDLEADLLRRLSGLLAPSLYVEFDRHRPAGVLLRRALGPVDDDPPGTSRYAEFVSRLASGGLAAHFRAYPVVARLLATVIDSWVRNTADLFERVDADADELVRLVAGPQAGDGRGLRVCAIQPSLSDYHHGGQSVAVLTLQSGHKVVHKPRDLAMESVFRDIAEWLNRRWVGDDGPPLRVPGVVCRPGYGWTEYVDQRPCDTAAEARRYFRRAGMLLAVLHVLHAADGHHGNLIAAGEFPVLVDAETLLHPVARPLDADIDSGDEPSVARSFRTSVLRTLMLPAWQVSGDGRFAYDISGLGGGSAQRVAHLSDWQWINTDGMVLRYTTGVVPGEKNVVRVGDRVQSAHAFGDEVVSGFTSMYRFLEQHRDELLATRGPLAGLSDLPVRFLFRHTRIYQSVITAARQPDATRSGLLFSVELDALSRALLGSDQRPGTWPILAEELAALGGLDIPYCQASTSADSVSIGGGVVAACLREPVLPVVLDRIRTLSEDDLAWQVSLISGSFHAQLAQLRPESDATVRRHRAPDLTSEDSYAEAGRLGRELLARRIGDRGEGAEWLGLGMVGETERVQVELVGDPLYEGRCGIALFLAALQKVCPQQASGELLAEALSAVQRGCDVGPRGVGARASMIYALVTIGDLTGDPSTVAMARTLASRWTAQDADADTALDVLSGSAGAVLGLLTLWRATGDQATLDLARAFGTNLLRRRVSHRGLPRAWATLGPQPLTGFSHGAAGISYALLRLFTATGDGRFRSAALEGIAYERAHFSSEARNWPDLRDPSGALSYPDQWCHGAAGIALARLGGLEIAGDEAVVADIQAALTTTRERGLGVLDHVCCGNMGRVEALWVGAARLGRRDWAAAARHLAGQALDRSRSVGGYRLFANLPEGVHNPGFFRGVSGIGYQWLRLAEPTLPSVLTWQ